MRTVPRLLAIGVALAVLAAVSHAENEPQTEPSKATKEAAPPALPKEPAPPASVTIIAPREAHGVLGRDVRSPTNEDMGRMVDVIVDRTGTVRAAVIDFGGFLGVGSRKIAVDWNALQFAPDDSKRGIVTLALTRDQVKAAPEYKEKQTVIVLGPSGSLQSLPTE